MLYWEKATGHPFDPNYMSPHLDVSSQSDFEHCAFSLDLPDAVSPTIFHRVTCGMTIILMQVLRQARFIQNMSYIGWISQNNRDHVALSSIINAALDRYVRFMAFDADDTVPPLDVDLVFHTHQLSGSLFR